MKNPHIIVGPGRMCVCGSYGKNNEHAIRCAEVIKSLTNLETVARGQLIENLADDVMKISTVIRPLIQDCD